MADGKIHPPSDSRIAEARRAGVVPRPLSLGLCAGLLTLAAYVSLFGAELASACVQLVRAPLLAFARRQPEQALWMVRAPLAMLVRHALSCLVVIVLSSALLSWIAQGPRFSPPHAAGKSFSEPRPSRTVPLLLALLASVLFMATLRDTLWLEPSALMRWLRRWLSLAAAAVALLALIDVSFARAAFFRALFMTRREQREELREAYGSPETRAARDRVRRELGPGA